MALMTGYNENKGFALPTGTIQAVCAGVYDLGEQESTYEGKTRVGFHTVLLFELSELDKDGNRLYVPKWYNSRNFSTESKYKPGLQKDIEQWMNKQIPEDVLKEGFDLEILYGMNAFLNIIKTEKGKFKIASLSPVPKELTKMKPIRALDDIPDFILKKRNVSSDEQHNGEGPEDFDDDIPF